MLEEPEGDVAKIESIVTDQGNGSSYCGNCKQKIDLLAGNLDRCQGCGKRLVMGEIYIPRGGSDF